MYNGRGCNFRLSRGAGVALLYEINSPVYSQTSSSIVSGVETPKVKIEMRLTVMNCGYRQMLSRFKIPVGQQTAMFVWTG